MTKLRPVFVQEDYVLRIGNASGLQLTIITYEIALHYLEVGEFEKAQRAVESLMDTLNLKVALSLELMPLYIYVSKILIDLTFVEKSKVDEKLVKEAFEILEGLYESFAEIYDKTEPELQEEKQVFAGLTYKNGKLIEYVKEEENGGFKA